MNPFLLLDDYPRNVPRRVYARVDDIESLDEGGISKQILFEAVDADWYDEVFTSDIPRDELFKNIPLAIIQVSIRGEIATLINGLAEIERDRLWFEIELSENRQGLPALIYTGLFAQPNEQSINQPHIAPSDLCQKLNETFSLDDIDDADEEVLQKALDQLGDIDFAAVYDVGQGNCNGLCATNGSVLCYFDLGGGVLGNKHTYPNQLKHFCFTNTPPVILSHWDWDHWSSANRDVTAIKQTWIVPRQHLGGVHRTFAQHVHQNGQLLIWPDNLRQLTAGQVTVVKCTGNGRNHSGLAMILHEHKNESGQKMLFTGDARYNVIPQSSTLPFTNIIVPHHGADMRNKFTPACPKTSHARLAYSYGRGNSYHHPRQITRVNHNFHGWDDNNISSGAPRHYNIETGINPTGTPQHIMLRWDAKQLLPHLPCKGKCDLKLQKQ